jgi:hypothetical protein
VVLQVVDERVVLELDSSHTSRSPTRTAPWLAAYVPLSLPGRHRRSRPGPSSLTTWEGGFHARIVLNPCGVGWTATGTALRRCPVCCARNIAPPARPGQEPVNARQESVRHASTSRHTDVDTLCADADSRNSSRTLRGIGECVHLHSPARTSCRRRAPARSISSTIRFFVRRMEGWLITVIAEYPKRLGGWQILY